MLVGQAAGTVRIVARGSTTIAQTSVNSGAVLAAVDDAAAPFGDVVVAAGETTGAPVIRLVGNFSSVVVESPGVTLDVGSGSIGALTVSNQATNTQLHLTADAQVDRLVLNANANVSGNGRVRQAEVNANGSALAMEPDELRLAPNTTALVGGTVRETDTRPLPPPPSRPKPTPNPNPPPDPDP